MKKGLLFFFMLSLFSGCLSMDDKIEKRFKSMPETCSIAFKFIFYIRTIKVTPDVFYIQNLKTFKIYKMENDSNSILYHDNLPLGEYRIGYWTGVYEANDTKFRVFAYSNHRISVTEKKKYNLGKLLYKCDVDSLIITPVINEAADNILLEGNKYMNYSNKKIYQDNIKLEETMIYKKCRYGTAYDLNLKDDNNGKAFLDLKTAIEIEEIEINKKIDEALKIYKEKELSDAVIFLDECYKKTNNLNFLTKKGEVLYEAGKIEEAKIVFDMLLIKDPNLSEFYDFYGILSYKKGDITNAKGFLYKAISFGSRNTESFNIYTKFLLDDNNIENALILNEFSLKLSPDNKEGLRLKEEIGQKKKN